MDVNKAIKDKTLKRLISNMFVEHHNLPQVIDMLFATCPDNAILHMLEILLSEEDYIPFKKESWVLINLSGYQLREMGDQVVLQDMKLMREDKFIGYIKDSSNYSEEFEPYHDKMEVNTFICDTEGNIKQKVLSIHSCELTLINDADSIASLNNIKNNLTA